MDNKICELLYLVGERNVLHAKYLNKMMNYIAEYEKKDLVDFLVFMEREGYSIPQIAEAYLMFLEDTLSETKYFVENKSKHYRYSTYKEVADLVYNNEEYMNNYMIGLQLSGYVWVNHLKIHRFLVALLNECHGKNYLEVGPGHGRYFAEAIEASGFRKYTAVDVSDTSLRLTEKYVKSVVAYSVLGGVNIEYRRGDFMEMKKEATYDMIVISEVLEHVECPLDFMKKARSLLSDEGIAYINVPVNAPEIDHIFLFQTVEDVESIVMESGFTIVKKYIATANDIPYEKAIKKKRALNVALALKKKLLDGQK